MNTRMSSSAHAPSHSDASRQVHFFEFWGEERKTHVPALPPKPPGELPDEDRERVHAATHRELECQRSAPQAASTNLVLGERTLKTSKNSTTTNWSVNDLLTSAQQGTLAWEETVKTSRTTTTRRRRRTLSWEKTLLTFNATATRNWSINGLLEEVENRWHFGTAVPPTAVRDTSFATRCPRG